MTLRLSTTRTRSASSSAPPSPAATNRVLSSPALLWGSLLLSSGCRLRPRVSPATTRLLRGSVSGSRLLPARLPMPALGLRAIGGTAVMGPRILGPRRLLAGSTRLGPRWCTGSAPARVRDMLTEALLLARRPILGLLASLRPIGGAGRALTVFVLRLALRGPGPTSRVTGGIAGWSGCPCCGGLPAMCAAGLPLACESEVAPLGGALPPRGWPDGQVREWVLVRPLRPAEGGTA